MNELLPWHRAQWQNLLERLRAGNFPHALLLAGPPGIGKNQFAVSLVQTVLCETGATHGQACGRCRSCLLYAANNHPDLRVVSPPEPGKVIGVDQVREVSQYLAHTSQYGGHKAVIITPADRMNINAANSLLKTLEEPSAWSLLVLVSDQPKRLPATVLSRCQRLVFTVPGAEQAGEWLAARIGAETDPMLLLALAEGAPLLALDLAEHKVPAQRLQIMKELERLASGDGNLSDVAEHLLKIGAQQTLYWLYSWVADMIRYVSSGGAQYMINRDMQESIMRSACKVGLQGMHSYLQQVNEAIQASSGQMNAQLLMENVLITWQDMFRQPH